MDAHMNIKNVQLKAIEARRYSELKTPLNKVRIDHNSNFKRMEQQQGTHALIDFEYTASYGPIGMIKIEGILIFEDPKTKTIIKEWNDTRKMPNEIASALHTAIMHACVPQAVGIAKDLRLPPPIPLPQVRLGKNPQKGGAELGPEVA